MYRLLLVEVVMVVLAPLVLTDLVDLAVIQYLAQIHLLVVVVV
jgi:hypothetical protein